MLNLNKDRQNIFLKWVVAVLIVVILVLSYFLYQSGAGFAGGFTNNQPNVRPLPDVTVTTIQYDSAIMLLPRGECTDNLPTTGDYVKLTVNLKSKTASIPVFEWNGLSYASAQGCFKAKVDGVSMSSFIPQSNSVDSVFFHTEIRSTVYNDEFEFSIKVHDRAGTLIGKYPNTGESEKKKVVNIRYPATIDGLIKFENNLIA